MKTAAKVFLIIGKISAICLIVLGVLFAVVSGLSESFFEFIEVEADADIDAELAATIVSIVYLSMAITFVVVGILGTIFSSKALRQMKTKKPSVGICVCCLIFVNVLAGIFLLCSSEDDYGEPKTVEDTGFTIEQ